MVKNNCKFCHNYICQEIGDNDFGGIYDEHPSCSLFHDLNEDDEVIEDFDREVVRDCCELDIWLVSDEDSEIGDLIYDNDSFNNAYELFNKKYK